MKNNLFSFITLIFIFVHSATYHMISTEALPDAVRDGDGNELRSYYVYYVQPVTGLGGIKGLVPYPTPKKICKYGVRGVPYSRGNTVAFHQPVPPGIKGAPIYENSDLNITFATSVGCNSTDVWRKGELDKTTGQSFVTIGVGGNPPPSYQTRGNAFQIRKTGANQYKFVYCPPTCISCNEICEDVCLL